ncbi:MAG: hypothetical protein V3T77_11125 [Planctomycetota bacterium]
MRAWLWIIPLFVLSACHSMEQRRQADELRSYGDLHGARQVMERIATRTGSSEDIAELRQLDHELGKVHFQNAQYALQRLEVAQAYRELTLTLRFDPSHMEAHQLADRLWLGHELRELWHMNLNKAMETERWIQVFELLASEEDPLFPRAPGASLSGVFELAWQQLRQVFHRADQPRQGAELAQLTDRGQGLLLLHERVLGTPASHYSAELERWHHRVRIHQQVEELQKDALELRWNGNQEEAWRSLRRALFLSPQDDELRAEVLRQQDSLRNELQSRLEQFASQGNWEGVVRTSEILEQLGGVPTMVVGLSMADIQRRHSEGKLEQAKTFELRGLLGNALMTLHEAALYSEDPRRIVAEAARVRAQLLSIPLVQVLADHETPPLQPELEGLTSFSTLYIVRGPARYSEERNTQTLTREGTMSRVGFEWRENPAFLAAESRWQLAVAETKRLRLEWQAAPPMEKDHAKKRFLFSQDALDHISRRMRQLTPRHRYSTWKPDRVPVLQLDLKARLEIPVMVYRAGAVPEDRSLVELLEIADESVSASREARRPGDPKELPSREDARWRLQERCSKRFVRLVKHSRVNCCRRLVESSRESFQSGKTLMAVELAVRGILEFDAENREHPICREAKEILNQALSCSPRAIDALAP